MSSLPADNEEFRFEKRHASPTHLLTKIESLSKLLAHGISKLESMEFQSGQCKWKVIIFPDGDEEGKKSNHISVHLCIVGHTSLPAVSDVTAISNFFLYDHLTKTYLSILGKARRFHAIDPVIRFPKLMDKKTFAEPSNGYVSNDNFVFGAEVFVVGNVRVVERVSPFDLKDPFKREWGISVLSRNVKGWSSEEIVAGGYNWKIEVHPNGSLTSGVLKDVSIYLVCIDSKNFGAHKKVKATCLFCIGIKNDPQRNLSIKGTQWFSCLDQNLYLFHNADIGIYLSNLNGYFKLELSVEAIQDGMK